MTVLFWDIDGTLLTTARAGAVAWEAAVHELTGREFDLAVVRIAGLTDYQIAVKTYETLGLEPDDAMVAALVRRYEALLPSSLPSRNGHVMPNVREILDELRQASGIRSYLLTGNTREGARAKLTYYGLSEHFADGAFAEDTGDRATIAARGLALARRAGPVALDRLFVVGDTPHDIQCADTIGARTIAVATGGYTLTELAAHAPWHLVPELPSAEAFLELIEPGHDSP